VGGISESGWKNQALFTFDRLEATIFGKVDIWVFDFKEISDRLTSEGHHSIPFLL
jgi:hypothetical protein